MPGTRAAAGIALCAEAAVCLWAAVHERRVPARLRRHGLRTCGTVYGPRSGTGPRPSPVGLHLPVGSRVPVVYLSEDPRAVRVFTTRYRAIPVLMLMACMTAFLGAAVGIAMSR